MPYCESCGTPLPEPHSGMPVRHCPACGQRVSGQGLPPRLATIYQEPVRYASFWERFAGWLIDTILVGVVNFVVTIALDTSGAAFLLTFLISAGYYIILNGLGATVGKMAVGLRVVDANGDIPGLGRGLVRYIVSIVSGLALLLGYFWVIWHPEKRTWHDLAAGTYVVRG